ncbi:hypothetical protein DUNSADRAFT_17299 [Dunaliella salina]|uniref:Uncharacterized protein n=1 Tax=Dunaliella salina TaxID=3046 RepID=A0ABQ7G211_DUNSA|nr:hypothetical protein DUNSADRAFT_17299 [Dunaliella salina]|eukprot:KAF5828642.1 hypothetical protein DUNSADRAFT_17299 [Dunaliella salina]
MLLIPALPALTCGICIGVGVVLVSALRSAADWASPMGLVGTVCFGTLALLVWLMHVRATKAEAVAKQVRASIQKRALAPSQLASKKTFHGFCRCQAREGLKIGNG